MSKEGWSYSDLMKEALKEPKIKDEINENLVKSLATVYTETIVSLLNGVKK